LTLLVIGVCGWLAPPYKKMMMMTIFLINYMKAKFHTQYQSVVFFGGDKYKQEFRCIKRPNDALVCQLLGRLLLTI
jgi:hypothetical protein